MNGDGERLRRHGALPWVKLEGLGNSYLYLDADLLAEEEWPAAARLLSSPARGVGADGVIAVAGGAGRPFRMRIWNADGSEAEMCGNGVRGFCKYLYDRGRAPAALVVETGAGPIGVQAVAFDDGGRVAEVEVDMGRPILEPDQIPLTGVAAAVAVDVALPLPLVDRPQLLVTAVSMGNPHLVHFADRLWDAEETARVGRVVEHHPQCPRRTNFHVAVAVSRERVEVRHWERGSGLTAACGTGACAVLVAGVLSGRLERAVEAALPGGSLQILWGDDGRVRMRGPSRETARGIYEVR